MAALRDADEAIGDLDRPRPRKARYEAARRQREEINDNTDGSQNLEAEGRMLLDHGTRVGRHERLQDDGKRGNRAPQGGRHDEHKQGDGGALGAGLGEAKGQVSRDRRLDPVVDGDAH